MENGVLPDRSLRSNIESARATSLQPRILIVDDHEIVREGIRNLLRQSRPDWNICGQATNGKEAVAAVESLRPDAVILDVTMPIMSGLEAAARIAKSGAESRVLIFTMHESESLGREVREAGAHGFVLKSQAARNLILAIETLLEGGTFFGAPVKP
jgi:DNA-binding NarL/FixJ family response regulator